MGTAIHYEVSAKLISGKNSKGEYEFKEILKKFRNDEPIQARQEAFSYYKSLLDVLLESKGTKYESDKQAGEILNSFFDPKTSTKFLWDGEEFEISDSFGNGVGVFLVSDEKQDMIHGIGSLWEWLASPESIILGLEKEYDLFKEQKLDTAGLETEIVFCDRNELMEGYREDEPSTYTILQTPFDWSGMDKPYWWGTSNEGEEKSGNTKTRSFEEIISDGESNQVEFKPALLYNFKTEKAAIGVKGIIAKSICAFLNSKGGFLFIGIKDDGQIQGLSFDFSLSGDKDPKDYFRLEFDDMISQFLPHSCKTMITGEFITIKEMEIFVIIVQPSKTQPVFLNGQHGKEFWVRWTASSRQYKDIEDITNYCLEHWNR